MKASNDNRDGAARISDEPGTRSSDLTDARRALHPA